MCHSDRDRRLADSQCRPQVQARIANRRVQVKPCYSSIFMLEEITAYTSEHQYVIAGAHLLSVPQAERLMQMRTVARYVALAHSCAAWKAAAQCVMPQTHSDMQRRSAQSSKAA